jgi:hypothetical protein
METKECRHCKQPIHKDARRCQHCQGMQGWISDQKDPRMLTVVFIPLLLILGGVIIMTRTITKLPERSEINPASFSVANITYRFGNFANRDYIYVYGDLTNTSNLDAARTFLRVNLLDQQNKPIDTFVQDTDCVTVPAKETKRFRIVAYTPTRSEEVKKAEIIVDRCRAKGRWD